MDILDRPAAPAGPRAPKAPAAPAPQPPARSRRLRLLGRIAVVACAPYLALKLAWVLGWNVGVVDEAAVPRGTWIAANAVTFLMDAIAAVVAHTLTRPAGLRAPAWLLLLPLWTASGLLLPLMVSVPAGALASALTGAANPMLAGDFLQPWVFLVVYGGFIVEGITLLGAFAVYAHQRWGAVLRRPVSELPDTGTRTLQRVFLLPSAAVLAAVGVLKLLWGAGSTLGLQAGQADKNIVQSMGDLVAGLMAPAAAAGLLLLLFPGLARSLAPRLRARVPIALAWAGGASAFAWGGTLWLAWTVSDALAGLGSTRADTQGLPGITGLLELLAGLAVLCAGAFALAEQHARARTEAPPHPEDLAAAHPH